MNTNRILLSLGAAIILIGWALIAQTASYPTSLATSQNLKVGVNGVSTLLTADITSGATTIPISSCAGIVAYTLVTIESEIMDVVGCSGTVLTVDARGFDNTTAVVHLAGAVIYANVDAWHHNSLSAEVQAIESSLGANMANVPAYCIDNGFANAIACSDGPSLPPLRVGLGIDVYLSNSLQAAGLNTFTYPGSSPVPIVSHRDTSAYIAAGYVNGIIHLVFDGSHFEDQSQ